MGSSFVNRIAREIGEEAVKKAAALKTNTLGWYKSTHMAAASRAIAERIPLVDFILEVRDARIPLSSGCELLKKCHSPSSRRIIVLNKTDLSNRSQLKEWIKYFEQQNFVGYGVNSHNKDNVKQFLNFLQAQVRELGRNDQSSHTATMMIVGIPNVGKSALAKSLHHLGRISAAEKGKLKHATVSPHPGETKDISSLKIGSHPNIYVLDTPGTLPSEIVDFEVCTRLALTGAIGNCLAGEKELARYFLAILNMSDEYKKWEKFSAHGNDSAFREYSAECSCDFKSEMKQKKHHPTDHTQDFMVHNVRQTLFDSISFSNGNVQNEKDLEKLIELQFTALREAFLVPVELGNDARTMIASKLLNLYNTGRLGHYTLDPLPLLSKSSMPV